MSTTATTGSARSTSTRVTDCACHLYDAECAVHAARQSHVSAWIAAAEAKLHEALVEHLAAVAAEQAACSISQPGRGQQ